jgi:predicted TIM-barrel fold metal-dependent hydrolase
VRAAVKALGPERCLFGTDAPYGFHEPDGSYDYGEILGWVERLPISAAAREKVLFGNALELLRLAA